MSATLTPASPGRWLIACDKFKGTLDSLAVGQSLAKGLQSQAPGAEVRVMVVSDGGQGFLQALGQTHPLEWLDIPCRDALGRPRTGQIGWDAQQAAVYIESAQALGLPWLQPKEQNPWQTHSAGLGDLLMAAHALHPRQIFLGLGGSATCDGGLGCLKALGWQFLDAQNQILPGIPASLAQICRIQPPARDPGSARLKLICDVANPPVGDSGGVRVYSPQKGATAGIVQQLEEGMQNWVRVLESALDKQIDLSRLAGGGAAGCLGLGLSQLLLGELIPGAAWMLEQLAFFQALNWADRVVTGEGAFDASSLQGKITGEILRQAAQMGKQIIVVSGQPPGIRPASTQIFCLQERDPQAGTSSVRSRKLLEQIGKELAGGQF